MGYVPPPAPRDDERHFLRCRVCSYCEHRETVAAATHEEAARPCPNCGARDWRDSVVRREGMLRSPIVLPPKLVRE